MKRKTKANKENHINKTINVVELQPPQFKSPLPIPTPKSLTPKEKRVLEFIESFIAIQGFSPTYQEICDQFGFASFNSVQNYMKQLSEKGYLQISPFQKRAIQLLKPSAALLETVSTAGSSRPQLLQAYEGILSLPLLGSVAAGQPLEKISHDEEIQVPPSMVKKADSTFALKVVGQSMIDEGIHDGDILLVQKMPTAKNGDLVVATIDQEATVKRFFTHPSESLQRRIELRPSNSTMKSFWYDPSHVKIEGQVVGLIRKF